MLQIKFMTTFGEIAFSWMAQNTFDDNIGLSAVRQQAITWTSVDWDLRTDMFDLWYY